MDSIRRLWRQGSIPALRWNSGLKFSSPFLILAPSKCCNSKAHSTVETYRRYINKHVLPRGEMVRANDMEPIAVQNWLRELHKDSDLSNSTLVKIRNVMLAIFKHAKRYGFLPRTQESNPMTFVRQTSVSEYEPVVLTLSQCVSTADGRLESCFSLLQNPRAHGRCSPLPTISSLLWVATHIHIKEKHQGWLTTASPVMH